MHQAALGFKAPLEGGVLDLPWVKQLAGAFPAWEDRLIGVPPKATNDGRG